MLRALVASMSLLATSSMFGLTATIANVGGLGAGVGAGVGGVGAGVGAVSVPASCGGAGNASKDGGGDDDELEGSINKVELDDRANVGSEEACMC